MKRTSALLLVLLASPLAFAAQDEPDTADTQDAEKAAQEAKAAAKERESREEELTKARLELPHAEVEVRLAEMKAAEEQRKAGLALAKAEHGLKVAEAAVRRFEELSAPLARDEATFAVERAENRLVSEQQDLDGILRIYAEEPEASAKDEIIRRHRMSVKFAGLELDFARRRLADKTAELDAQEADLAFKVAAARAEVDQARSALERGALAARLEVGRKKDALTLLKSKAEKLARKLEESDE